MDDCWCVFPWDAYDIYAHSRMAEGSDPDQEAPLTAAAAATTTAAAAQKAAALAAAAAVVVPAKALA
jgi:hypothetical protein